MGLYTASNTNDDFFIVSSETGHELEFGYIPTGVAFASKSILPLISFKRQKSTFEFLILDFMSAHSFFAEGRLCSRTAKVTRPPFNAHSKAITLPTPPAPSITVLPVKSAPPASSARQNPIPSVVYPIRRPLEFFTVFTEL